MDRKKVALPATATHQNLLCYLPKYKVLICKECRYAIQPSAISRHLKDLHHIYRLDRKLLLEYAEGLDLAAPQEVKLPCPHEPAIDLLTTESGLACSARECEHLCMTVKRMKSHWSSTHRNVADSDLQWSTVKLQTFFRGNQLRYFVVDYQSHTSSRVLSFIQRTSLGPSPQSLGSPLPEGWTPKDITLFDHFRNCTYETLSRHSKGKSTWGNAMVSIAIEHDFLKHGILACSALHLAYLQPSVQRHHHMVATLHQDLALPLFRCATNQITTKNCNAVLAFSQLLLVYCFASEAADGSLFLVEGKEGSSLPDWLGIIRGSCAMFREVWNEMEQGILSNIMDDGRAIPNEILFEVPDNSAHTTQLRELLCFPCLGKEFNLTRLSSLSILEQKKIKTYTDALASLVQAFALSENAKQKNVFSIWTAVQIWPARVSVDYLELLKKKDPGALVLLAHYCVLLEPLEEHWFMSSFRKRLLTRIWEQLDQEARKWIVWPMKEVGLDLEADLV